MEPNKAHLTNQELNDLIKKAEEFQSSLVLKALLELKQRRAESNYYMVQSDGSIKALDLKPGQVFFIKR